MYTVEWEKPLWEGERFRRYSACEAEAMRIEATGKLERKLRMLQERGRPERDRRTREWINKALLYRARSLQRQSE